VSARKVILIGGGVRSGKSAFAVSLARRLGARRAFIATARAYDDEMRDRIARHQAERGAAFRTLEEPVALAAALRRLEGVDAAVVDCLTLWLSNLLLDGLGPPQIEERIEELAAVLAERRFHTVLVTNEVGMGVHPESALGRAFRDLAGRAHQRLARCADEIHFAVLGVVVRLKPGPVELQLSGDQLPGDSA
jgi:adenosylcobinamide kinase/adenosylcobinamide-phosphate guanylyltransferase